MFSLKEVAETLESGISTVNQVENGISNHFSGIDTSDRFDPKASDDPIAEKTYWSSCSRDRRNSSAYTLGKGDNKLIYKASASANILSYSIIIAGVIAFVASIFQFIEHSNGLIFFGIGIFFIAIGYILRNATSDPILFDKNSGVVSKGVQMNFPLQQIHAMQIVSIDIEDDYDDDDDRDLLDFRSRSTRFYELNIVRTNAHRIER